MAIMSDVRELQTVFHTVRNPQMALRSKKGAYGVSEKCEKVCMLLPQWSQGSTLKSHMLFITNSTTVASQTYLLVHLASTSHGHGEVLCSAGILVIQKHAIRISTPSISTPSLL